jgi:hypothetical protein
MKGSEMPSFFNRRTNLQVVGDLAVGAIGGLKNGFGGTLILGGMGITIATPIAGVAMACALGGMLTIIPAIYLYEELFRCPSNTPFLVKAATDMVVRAAFAFGSGCLGAAILGFAMVPVGLAALTASFTFGLLSTLTGLIVDCTAPYTHSEDKFSALRLS